MIRYIAGGEVLKKSAVEKMMDQALSSAEIKEVRKIEQHCEAIADSLSLIHGGDWMTQIDHQSGYVLVHKR